MTIHVVRICGVAISQSQKTSSGSAGCSPGGAPLANATQRQFLHATRQDLLSPSRALSSRELAFMHAKFFNNAPLVSWKQFETFWQWFGKTLQKLRYQVRARALFLQPSD